MAPPSYRFVQNLPFRFCRYKEKAFLSAEPARGRRRNQSALDADELVFYVYWLNDPDMLRSGTA
jgi:hypothetical protein